MRIPFQKIRIGMGSLKMAVTLLITIGAVLAWGTFYEARWGTAAVQRFIYHSWWFQTVLGFLAVNLAIAALERFPWKKKHIPFVAAHVGIIAILGGGILGGHFGIEGQLIIPEGETRNDLQLSQKQLVVVEPNPGVRHSFPTSFETTAWNHTPNHRFEIPLEDQTKVVLTVDRYYPNAKRQETIVKGSADSPAISLVLHGEQERQDRVWLMSQDPNRFGASWREFHFLFLKAESAQEKTALLKAKEELPPKGVLRMEFSKAGKTVEIPVPDEMGNPLSISGTPYRVTFKQFFPDLTVTPHGILNRSEDPRNPAVALTLSGPEGTDSYLLFALRPELTRLEGLTYVIPVDLRYRYEAGRSLPPHSVNIIALGEKLSAVFIGERQERQMVDNLIPGQRYRHPWGDFEFEVEEFLPRARVKQEFFNQDNDVRMEVLHVRAQQDGKETQTWLPVREEVDLPVGKKTLRLEYRPVQYALPFSVRLLDFRKIDYPGTQMAAAFESDVELHDPERQLTLVKTIRMNMPLKHRGFSLFQASFIPGPPEITILAVRKDPGTPLVYFGFLVVVFGVVGLFIWRRPTR